MNVWIRAVAILMIFFGIKHSTFARELNLSSVLSRWNEVSFDLKIEEQNIGLRDEDLKNAGKWENPSIEISGGNRIGLESGERGFDPTQIRLNQPIPILRTVYKKSVSKDSLESAKAKREFLQLEKEYEMAVEFHELQFQKAKYDLSKEKLKAVRKALGKEKGSLIRFLKPIDKSRLKIAENDAFVEVENSKGELEESIEKMVAYLQFDRDKNINIAQLDRVIDPPRFERLREFQESHPSLREIEHQENSFKNKVKLEKSKIFDDPIISVFSEQDYLADRKQNSYGVALILSVPIWNFNSAEISKAKINVDKYGYLKSRKKLSLSASLYKSYQHLMHLIELEKSYRTKVIPNSKNFLILAIKSFSVGETSALGLVDAYENYFDAQIKYSEVLKNSWNELAAVRFLGNQKFSDTKGGK